MDRDLDQRVKEKGKSEKGLNNRPRRTHHTAPYGVLESRWSFLQGNILPILREERANERECKSRAYRDVRSPAWSCNNVLAHRGEITRRVELVRLEAD